MKKKVKFSIATPYVKSHYEEVMEYEFGKDFFLYPKKRICYEEVMELEFNDDLTEKQISEEIKTIYFEWLATQNYDGWEIIT